MVYALWVEEIGTDEVDRILDDFGKPVEQTEAHRQSLEAFMSISEQV